MQGVYETPVGFGARVLKHISPCPHHVLVEKERLASCDKTQLSTMRCKNFLIQSRTTTFQNNCRKDKKLI